MIDGEGNMGECEGVAAAGTLSPRSQEQSEAWAASDRAACHPRTADLAESMDEDERFLLESPPDW